MRGITVAIALTLVAGCGGDPHARAACQHVREVEAVHARTDPTSLGAQVDAVKAILAAVKEATEAKSSGLNKAASATDLGSQLPLDNPLYRNPEDVAYAAVSDWCRAHG